MTTEVVTESAYLVPDPDSRSAYRSPQMLEDLASRPEFSHRADDLRALAAAVAGDPDHFGGWDRVNLPAAFNPAATIRSTESRNPHRVLGAIAAAAMFAPLFWTWYSLRAATSAYSNLLDEASADYDGQSFLQLWVQGFGDRLATWHRLGFVAMVSAGLIAVVILALLAARLTQEKENRAHDEAMQAAETDLAAALACAQREFALKTLTDGTAAESVAQSIRRLEQQQHAVEIATREFGSAVKSASDHLGETVRNVEVVLGSISASTTTLDSAAMSLAATSRDVGLQTQGNLDRWANQMTAATAAHGDQLLQATNAYRAGLDATATSLSENISLAANKVNAASVTITDALVEFKKSRDLATKALDSVTIQAGQENLRLTERTSEAIANLAGLAANSHRSLAEQSAAAVHGVAESAAQEQQRLAHQSAEVIKGVNDVVTGVWGTLQDMQARLGDLAGAINIYTEAVTSQQSLTRDQIDEMKRTTDLLGRVSRTVDEAARGQYGARNTGRGR